MVYEIANVDAGGGMLGIGPMPGRTCGYEADLAALLRWGPGLVLTMTPLEELRRAGADGMPDDLAAVDVAWRHLPIADFGKPDAATAALWPDASALAHDVLRGGGRVFAHCWGGHGRSGMALMRLMVEAGELPDHALERLRDARPGAVETEAQRAWAGRV